VARWHTTPIPVAAAAEVLTPDDLMAGTRPRGRRVVLFDDDHYYLGGVLAELLSKEGYQVQLVTPASQVSTWTVNTMEQHKIQRRVLLAGVTLLGNTAVDSVAADHVVCVSTITDLPVEVAADSVVMVTARLPEDGLLLELQDAPGDALATVRGIGDAWAPGTIANAVWSGRRFAEELDAPPVPNDEVPFRREVAALSPTVYHPSFPHR
jgi:dimethylamine/trimethylamine dehydrogenase